MKFLCAVRDLMMTLEEYERDFMAGYGISLKEGMVLCCISQQRLTASDIAERIDLSSSNCSKVIRLVEEKGLIERGLGHSDKRNMLFCLTESGRALLLHILEHKVPVPEALKLYQQGQLNERTFNRK